ncbi:alpha-D-ribose 1-methylphosphonate 5-triphosphate diphosphatase [Bacillus sp. PAMC26568]|nr:alpha-D-ribose 1-methylphosphonate 5-triphosphate diphosphatase [Bacillus sp. PAMC26568]
MKIYHAKIVTPEKVIENGTIEILGERIVSITEGYPELIDFDDIDAEGKWVLPGLVDSHSDAIELELEPRPNSTFPIEISFYELEKKLVGEGITTIYHSLSLMEENAKKWIRQNNTVLQVIHDIKRLSSGRQLIRHKTHLRYEITNTVAVENVKKMMEDGKIDQLSFMDHTPGQGQFRDLEVHKRLLMEHRHFSEEEAKLVIEESKLMPKLDGEILAELSKLAAEYKIPLASHDDDTLEKIELVKSWNAVISEFPIELEVAVKAKEEGLYVVMGAPNALLGKSHSNNVSALEAVMHGAVDILCSDYYPSSLLHAAFKLYKEGMPIYQAFNMVSLNPAKALGIEKRVGSIEKGKLADLILVSEEEMSPVLQTVIVNGQVVCQMNYHRPAAVPIPM